MIGNNGLSKRTTPTWEAELLISGASVFALLQLPAWLNDRFLALQIQLHDHYLNALALPLFLYVKVAVVCLAATFLLHLSLRAYWIGLVGVDSIFPGGPKLDHLRYGPYYQRHLKAHLAEDPETHIERADNRATLVFGFGVGLALVMLLPTVLVGIAAVLVMALTPLIGSENAFWSALLAFLLPVMALSVLPSLIDKLLGGRIPQGSWPARALTGCYRLMQRVQMDGAGNPLMLYLYGQFRGFGKAAALFALAGMLLGGLSAIDLPELSKVQPRSTAAHGMEAADYLSERAGSREYALRAGIPAPRAGDWLDLRVPVPARQPANDLPACQDDNRKAVTDCLAKHLRIRIDDKPVAADWQVQKATDAHPEALRAMIDIRSLPRGGHELVIDYLPNRKSPQDAWQERILFWN